MRKNTAIELDITKNIENGVKFYAKQFDDIKLKVKVFDGVREVDVEGQDVIVCIVKEDKTVIEQRKDITVEDNTLIIDLTKQATTALGKCQMEILLRDEEGTTSTSTVSYVVGEKLSATIVEIIQSEDDIEALNMIEEFIQNSNIDMIEIKEAVKELKEAVEEAQGTIDADLEAIISKIKELETTTLENIETAAGTIKEETILTITNKADEVLEEMEGVKGEVIGNVNEAIEKADEAVTKASETLETVNTVKEEVEKINDVIAEAMENIENTKNEAMDEIAGAVVVIEESKEDAVNVVSNAKNMAVSSVVDEKDKSITEIGTVKAGAVNSVNEAGVNGVNAVDTTRARAVGEIEDLKDNSTNTIEGLKVSAVEEIREAKTDALKQLQNNGNGIADALTTLKGELVAGMSLEAEAIKDNVVEEITTSATAIKDEAISNINTAKVDAVSEVEAVKDGAVSGVEAVKDGAVSSINAVKDNVLEDITTAKEEAIGKVNEACGVADAKIAEILRELESMVSEKEALLNTNALAGETKEELQALIEEAKRYEVVVRAWIDAQANTDLTEIENAIEELRLKIDEIEVKVESYKGMIGEDTHPECFRTAPLMEGDETHYVRCLSINNKYRVYYLKNAPMLNHYSTAGGCELWYTDTVTKSRVFEYSEASRTWGQVSDSYIRIYTSGGIVANTYSSNVDLYDKAGSGIMVPAKPGDPLTAPINTFNVEKSGEYLVSHTSLLTGSYKDAFEGSLVVRNINGNIYQDLISSDCRERVVRSKVKGVWTDWLVANADLYYTKEEVDAKLNEIKAMIGQ